MGAVRHALEVAALTGGRVTPTVLPALEAAGYAAYPGDGRGVGPVAGAGHGPASECGPEVLRLPAGRATGSGAARRSRGWRSGRGACLDGDGFVNAGGDVQLRQSAPFTVEVERPGGGALYLNLPRGEWGVATSSTLRRAWAGGHHLIDPATGRPLVSRFVQVTAVAPRVTRAEVLTKLAFLDEARLDALLGGAQVVAFEEGGRMLERTGGRWLKCENN